MPCVLRRRHFLVIAGLIAAPFCGFSQLAPVPVLNVLDNFETYSNAASLALAWPVYAGTPTVLLETNIVDEGTRALRLNYSVASPPYTNLLKKVFAAPQDWSGFNTLSFTYGGVYPSSTDDVLVQLLDHLGGVLGTLVIPGGTGTYPWTDMAWDLSNANAFTNRVNHTNLKDVSALVIGVVAGISRGSGSFVLDNVVAGFNGNLTSNPGFQDLSGDGVFGDGWSSFGAQQFANFLPHNTPGHGTFFSGTNGNAGWVSWPGTAASPGAKYRLTLWAAAEANWRAAFQVGLQFLAPDTLTVLTQRVVTMFSSLPLTTNYRSYSVIGTAPPGVAFVRPWVGYTNSAANTSVAQRAVFDDVLVAVETNRMLLILGSSVARGYGSSGANLNWSIDGSFGKSYGALLGGLEKPSGWRVVSRSVAGDNTSLVVDRCNRDENAVGADEVFIGLSLGNEGLPGATNPLAIYNHFYTGITNLVAMSRSNALLPLVGGGYPRNTYTNTEYGYLKQMDLLLNTLDVPSVNFLGATDDGSGHWPASMYSGDPMHPNDFGHAEMFLSFVPTVFEALYDGKPTPRWSTNRRFLRIAAAPYQAAPLTFVPGSAVHSFAISFRLRMFGTGVVGSVTLPDSAVHPTIEMTPAGLAYLGSTGQMLASGLAVDGAWHEVVLTHQYVRGLTWLYVDAVPVGAVSERLTPMAFVLGGHGSATNRPDSPALADYQNWFVHRSMLNAEEVQAQFRGALQQASLEVYAPLDDAAFLSGGVVSNRAQSLSVVAVNATNLVSQLVPPLTYAAGRASLDVLVAPNGLYELQRASDAGFANRTVLVVTNALPNGVFRFTDTTPPPALSFYRLVAR